MSWFWLFFIILTVILIPLIVWGIKSNWYSEWASILVVAVAMFAIVFLVLGFGNSVSNKAKQVRYEKEREQILYQINNLNENTDKIKLNEWILSYNDWINDVNTSKETFGYFSWYYSIDMTEHKIINLV